MGPSYGFGTLMVSGLNITMPATVLVYFLQRKFAKKNQESSDTLKDDLRLLGIIWALDAVLVFVNNPTTLFPP